MVNKYRAIFGWDLPEIDDALSDRFIFLALHRALDEMQAAANPA